MKHTQLELIKDDVESALKNLLEKMSLDEAFSVRVPLDRALEMINKELC